MNNNETAKGRKERLTKCPACGDAGVIVLSIKFVGNDLTFPGRCSCGQIIEDKHPIKYK